MLRVHSPEQLIRQRSNCQVLVAMICLAWFKGRLSPRHQFPSLGDILQDFEGESWGSGQQQTSLWGKNN